MAQRLEISRPQDVHALPLFHHMSWFDRVHRHGHRGRIRSGGPGVRLSSCSARRQRLRDCPTLDAEQSGLERARLSDFRSDRCAVHTESSLSPHPSGLAGVRRRVAILAAPSFHQIRHVSANRPMCRAPSPSVAPASTARASVPIRWWWLTLLAMTPVMAWAVFQTVADRSDTVARTLETFAADFIREFERPLIDERTGQPALHSEISIGLRAHRSSPPARRPEPWRWWVPRCWGSGCGAHRDAGRRRDGRGGRIATDAGARPHSPASPGRPGKATGGAPAGRRSGRPTAPSWLRPVRSGRDRSGNSALNPVPTGCTGALVDRWAAQGRSGKSPKDEACARGNGIAHRGMSRNRRWGRR